MDVRLPDGTLIRDVPEGTSKRELADKLTRNGFTVPPEWMAPAAAPAPTVMDRLKGAGETALSVGTSLIAQPVAALAGVNEFAGKVANAIAGNDAAVNAPSTAAQDVMQAMTYQPRTDTGREYLGNVAEASQALVPLAGLGGEMAALSQAAQAARPAGVGAATTARAVAEGTARDVAGPAGAAVVQKGIEGTGKAISATQEAAKLLPQRTREFIFGAEPKPTAGTMGSAGAAGTDLATQRAATAENLPVPIKLTEGQRTRDFSQQRFEQETAKDPTLGAPLRENSARQNQQLAQNFDAMIDDVGAAAPDMREAGRVVTDELTKAAARSKTEYRSLYQAADKAGELAAPVEMSPLAEFLNQNRAGRTSAPILSTIADEIGVRGIGGGSLADGSLTAGNATLKQAEELRKAVNKFAKSTDPNDMRAAAEIKKVIDQITEGAGGDLYLQARKARQRHAQLFEDNAIVSDLLTNRRNTADRRVALEDVFRRTILNGDRESIGMLRRTLDVSDQRAGLRPGTTGPGAQAWKELQGATLRHLLDEATKGVATDVAGNPIFSAAKLNNAIRSLDQGNRLDFILGKQRAQLVRDVNEVAKVVLTSPPGAVNTSNTASVLLAAIAEAGTTGALTGLPVPVLSAVRAGTQFVKDVKVRKRVQRALNPTGPAQL
jgi:hypothetical protein